MPTKKKSCFQITSVTQAQVAASSITDDTESLDDPDESRTEDVSSEIFDVSRADVDACERSSSEETLNNVGDPQEGHPHAPGPYNGVLSPKNMGAGRVASLNLGGSAPVAATAQPFVPTVHPLTVVSSPSASSVSASVAHTAPVSASCSSRFRVIKLDHGTGEPFRRGRWMCTEFYERDSDSNASRTVDGIRPIATLDHGVDRDSGLGATINSVVDVFSTQASENPTDSGYSLSLGPKLGSGASAFQPTGYTATSTPAATQANANVQPATPQNFHPNSVNDVHHGVMHSSPIMSPATQTQHQHRQQHFSSSALHAGLTPSQVPSPQITSAGPGAQGLSGDAGSVQGLLHQGSNTLTLTSILQGNDQQPNSPAKPSGGIGAPLTAITTSTSHSSGENAPATVSSTTATSLGGGPVHPQATFGGIMQGLPAGFLTEDSKQKSHFLPQFGANMVSGRDNVKPFIGEGLDLPTPSVKSLFGISIAMNVDEDR